MNFSELEQQVKGRIKVDYEPLLASYRAAAQHPNVDGFLVYMRDHQVIDTAFFTELHTRDTVDMTVADSVKGTRLGYQATVVAGDMAATAQSATDPHEAAPATEPEQAIQYEVLGELGKGAMGEVHLARDLVLRRKVALKSILPQMQQNQGLFTRFLAEMQITAQLDHPFIVPIYGVDTGPSGGLAYAMKVVQGRELGDLLDETKAMLDAGKPLDAAHSLEARLEAFLKVCDAIAYAHQRGIVHRDLKPANIMLGPFNVVYVMDWGIARLMGNGGRPQDHGVELFDADGADASNLQRTRVGSTIGTPIYMSPEQASGKNDELDGRSDLYALGLILQEIVTLTRAVGGTTLQEVLTNAKDGKRLVPEPPAPGKTVPHEIRAIVDKATRFNPTDRYASVAEFADDIRRYLRNEAIKAKPDTTLQGAGRWISKHRMATISLLLLALVLGAGATIGVLLYNQRVVAQQHNRELRLAELQATSAMRAQEFDATLQNYEGLLTKMVGAAGFALAEVKGGESALHFSDEFKAGPNALPGLVDSKYYGSTVSFDWPVASLAPGVSKDVVAGDLAAVNSLRMLARTTMLTSLDPSFHALSDEAREKALAQSGVPISRISLTLENGVHVEYPGMAGLAPDFDGRKEPSYIATSKLFEAVWGQAFKGRNGGMVLPCSAPLRDPAGVLLGVLKFEVDLNRAVASALETPDADHVELSLLVEKTGKVLAQSGQKEVDAEPEILGMKAVSEAIARGESGYLQTERGGHDVLVTYQPMSTVGWYLITVANLEAVKKSVVAAPGTRQGSVAAKVAATVTPVVEAPAPKPAPKPAPPPEPTAEPSAEPSAAPSASAPAPVWSGSNYHPPSAAPVASPPPPAPPPPTAAPANPFEPWNAYDKDKPK